MTLRLRPNSWIARGTDDTSVLQYAPLVDPAPLTVSLSTTNPTYASIEIVITNATSAAINVASITFTIQVGTDATDLTFTTDGIKGVPSDQTNWQVAGPSSTVISGGAQYVLGPVVGQYATLEPNASIAVQIYQIQANTVSGTSLITIAEDFVGSKGGAASFSVTTFPYGFFFNGLVANVVSGSSLVPVAQVEQSATVTLTWNGSVADASAYGILFSNAVSGQQQQTPTIPDQWTSPPLTSDTVFTVVVQATTAGGVPLPVSMSTSVAVRNPVLIATSLQTSGAIAAMGVITGVGICPPGTVIMFSGDTGNPRYFDAHGMGYPGTPYQGWQVCNGQNDAPDLRNCFIAGAGGQYHVGDRGGQDQITLNTSQIPSHDHGASTGNSAPYLNYSGVAYQSQGLSNGIMINRGVADPNGNRPNTITHVNWSEVQVQSHSHSIAAQGGGGAHENRPQYYALAYLYRLPG
jgi:microcystin-dependent protein